MRLFVIGATGVIGRRAVPLLLSKGHSVTAGVRQAGRRVGVANKGLDYLTVDLFDIGELRRAVAGHDAIINLATRMPTPAWKMMLRDSWRENDRIRTKGVANLVEAARRNGISRFVQESFALTYPDRGDVWIDTREAAMQAFAKSWHRDT
jgi:2-alkyl-3-oxoalkanoate reductase